MYTNKDSNLISYLRTKYGEECVRLLRKWEITIVKMADNRNHKRVTLKCIKASITPVSCKLTNPLVKEKLCHHPHSRKTNFVLKDKKHQSKIEHVRNK